MVAAWCASDVFQQLRAGRHERKTSHVVYDVYHNMARIEEYKIDGQKRRVCIHRKGATQALSPQHSALPEKYRAVGQPVLIPEHMVHEVYVEELSHSLSQENHSRFATVVLFGT